MPQFPGEDQPQGEPQVTPGGGISARATPIGTDVGQALEQGADVAQRVHFQAVQEANAAATTAFHNSQVQWELDHLHNPQTGLLNQQTGLAAPQAVDKTLADYDQFTSKSIAQMPNNEQRQMASQYVAAHRAQLSDQTFRYEDQQVKTAHMNIMENGIALESQAMIAHADDPQAVQHHFDAMAALRQDQGKALGWDPDTVQRFITEDQSKASLGMLRQMVADNKGPQASAWFAQNRDKLVGPQLTEATDMLKTKESQDQGLAIANSIINITRPENEPNDLQSSLTRLDGMDIKDANLYRDARNEIVSHYHLYQEAQNQRDGQIMDQNIDHLMNSPSHSYDADTWAQTPDYLKPRLIAAQKKVVADGYIQTEPEAYNDFHQRMLEAGADPVALNKIQPGRDYFGQVSPEHLKYMNDEKAKMAAAAAKQEQLLSQGNVTTKVANDLFTANHLNDVTTKADTIERSNEEALNNQQQGQFMMQLHKAIGAKQTELKRDLNDDEIKEEGKKLFASTSWIERNKNPDYVAPENRGVWNDIKGIASGFFGAGEDQDSQYVNTLKFGRYFESPEAKARAYSVRDIEPDERTLVLQALAKRGNQNPTADEIISTYNLTHAKPPAATPSPSP